MNKTYPFKILFMFVLFASNSTSFAQLPQDIAFSKIYLGASYTKTNPASHSENIYKQGGTGTSIQYLYIMRDEWILGLSAGFKSFVKKNDEDVSFFNASYDSQKLFRIYHPLWMSVGFKTMYLVGVERAHLPYTKAPDQNPQVGIGGVISAHYIINSNLLLQSSVTRWRGTIDNNLHAIDFNVGLNVRLVD